MDSIVLLSLRIGLLVLLPAWQGLVLLKPERVGVGSDIKLGRTTVRLMA